MDYGVFQVADQSIKKYSQLDHSCRFALRKRSYVLGKDLFYHLYDSRRDTIYKSIEKDLLWEKPNGNAYQGTNLQYAETLGSYRFIQ